MILIDTNLWLYACLEELPQHRQARSWLESEHNCTLCSADNGFRRFTGLRFTNPLC